MSGYTTFRRFSDRREAQYLQQFLIESGIEATFIDASSYLGPSVSGGFVREYEVQINAEKFAKANELLQEEANNMIKQCGEDYYLFSFSDEELYEVIIKQDEWNEFDYVLARRLLADRGKVIDEKEIIDLRDKRFTDLAKPERNHRGWIIAGYIFAFIGGLFGVLTGYVIATSKKTLPNGATVYTYTPSDRAHGKLILRIGIVVLIIKVLLLFIPEDFWDWTSANSPLSSFH